MVNNQPIRFKCPQNELINSFEIIMKPKTSIVRFRCNTQVYEISHPGSRIHDIEGNVFLDNLLKEPISHIEATIEEWGDEGHIIVYCFNFLQSYSLEDYLEIIFYIEDEEDFPIASINKKEISNG